MNNIYMSLQPNLTTLGPTYSNMPELYSEKRIYTFNTNNNTPLPKPEDKLQKYKKLMTIALSSVNTIYLYIPLKYIISSTNISAYITEIQQSTNLDLVNINLINIHTNTNILTENLSYNYDKKNGLFNIYIQNFDKNNTKVTATLIAYINETLSLSINLSYNPLNL